MNIPDDLVELSAVAAKFPGKTAEDLKRMSRRKQFPDLSKIGGTLYVRRCDVEAWFRGTWTSVRIEIAEAALRHGHLPPIKNRRAKAGV